jgi:hypothetical protein
MRGTNMQQLRVQVLIAIAILRIISVPLIRDVPTGDVGSEEAN